MTVNIDGKEARKYVHFCGHNPAFAKHLQIWGEAGTVTYKNKTTSNLADHEIQCIFVGYATDHTRDTYKMWNPKTNQYYITKDIIWLKRMYFPKPEVAVEIYTQDIDIETKERNSIENKQNISENTSSKSIQENDDANSDNEADIEMALAPRAQEVVTTRSGCVITRPSRYIQDIGAMATEYEIQLTAAEKAYYSAMKELKEGEFIKNEVACVGGEVACLNSDFGLVGADIEGGFANTHELKVMKFDEAMNTEDSKKWSIAVDEEHECMIK